MSLLAILAWAAIPAGWLLTAATYSFGDWLAGKDHR